MTSGLNRVFRTCFAFASERAVQRVGTIATSPGRLMLLILMIVLSLTSSSYAEFGEAQVTAVAGQTVTLSAGSSEGLTPGSVIDIVRRGGAVIHPLTHELLQTPPVPVCKVVVDQVGLHSSSGRAVGEVTSPKTGDLARFTHSPPASRPPKPTERGSLPVASATRTAPSQLPQHSERTPEGTWPPSTNLPLILNPAEFSSEAERAQFMTALRATYEFARSARDVKSMRNISQRLAVAERSLAAQNRRIEQLNASMETDVAQLREDVGAVKEEISLLQRKIEDLRQSFSGTGTTIRSNNVETPLSERPLPVQNETTATGQPPRPEGRSYAEQQPPARKAAPGTGISEPPSPWYFQWVTWVAALAVAAGTSAVLVLRRLRKRRSGESQGVEEEPDLHEGAPSPAEQIISPRKKRRVDFSAKEGENEQPDQGQHTDSQN